MALAFNYLIEIVCVYTKLHMIQGGLLNRFYKAKLICKTKTAFAIIYWKSLVNNHNHVSYALSVLSNKTYPLHVFAILKPT